MDVKEFISLFKIQVPVEANTEYYLNTLVKSSEFSNLEQLCNEFTEYEKWVSEQKGNLTLQDYKMGYAYHKIIDYITSHGAYTAADNYYHNNVLGQKIESKDNLFETCGRMLISFDFKSANYNVYRLFDSTWQGVPFERLPETWEALGKQLDIHPLLMKSKSFRQMVLGNLNPKMTQKISHHKMMEFSSRFPKESIVFLSHDEVVVEYNRITKMTDFGFEMPVRRTVMSFEKLPIKKSYIKNVWEERVVNDTNSSLLLLYKTLYGVPANKYFRMFKKYIINESVEDRDLQFTIDGEVVQWINN